MTDTWYGGVKPVGAAVWEYGMEPDPRNPHFEAQEDFARKKCYNALEGMNQLYQEMSEMTARMNQFRTWLVLNADANPEEAEDVQRRIDELSTEYVEKYDAIRRKYKFYMENFCLTETRYSSASVEAEQQLLDTFKTLQRPSRYANAFTL